MVAEGQGEIIKSFLVGLGFGVDESSLAVFNKSIQTATLRVTALYGAVNAFAGGIVFAFSKISEGFEEMGYQYHIIAPAINKAIVLRQELIKAYSAAGINIRKTIVDSIHLNMSLTKTRFAIEAIYKSVGSKFFGLLQAQSDAFRKKLYGNMPAIINILEKMTVAVFKAFEFVTILGGRIWQIFTRVYDFFVSLDQATDGWSTRILGVIAAWKLLNLSFLATPLGLLITGLTSLLLLFDDFQAYREGGKSLFDWGPVIPIINAITDSFKGLWTVVKDVVALFQNFFKGEDLAGLNQLNKLVHDLGDEFENINRVLVGISGVVDRIIRSFSGSNGFFTGVLNARDNYDQATFGFFRNLFSGSQPLGTNTSQSTQNINATMQTSINVSGSPNATATANQVAANQNSVSRDFTRNMKGPTR